MHKQEVTGYDVSMTKRETTATFATLATLATFIVLTHTLIKHLLDHRRIHLLFLIHLHDLGPDDIFRKLPHALTEHLFFLGEAEQVGGCVDRFTGGGMLLE